MLTTIIKQYCTKAKAKQCKSLGNFLQHSLFSNSFLFCLSYIVGFQVIMHRQSVSILVVCSLCFLFFYGRCEFNNDITSARDVFFIIQN